MKNASFTIGLISIGIICIGNMYYISLGGLSGVLSTMFTSILGILLVVIFGIVNRKRTKAPLIFGASTVVNAYSLVFADNYSETYIGMERGVIPFNGLILIGIIVLLVSIHLTRKRNFLISRRSNNS